MKNYLRSGIIGVLVLVSQLVMAQQTEERQVENFSKVKVHGIFNLILQKSDKEGIKIVNKNEDFSLSKVITRVENNTLYLEFEESARRKEYTHKSTWDSDHRIDVYLSYRNIEKIENEGILDLRSIEPMQQEKLKLEFSGTGKINLELELNELDLEISGAVSANLSGSARNQKLELSGAGGIDAAELKGENVEVELSGAGSARVNASQTLDAEASGVGSIKYSGKPARVNVSKSGLAVIKSLD